MDELKLILTDGREIPLSSGRTTIGRGADNDVVLDQRPLSRRHAEIHYDGRNCELVDLGSTNGTTVDGRIMQAHQPYSLHPGSVVSMGGISVFRVEQAAGGSLPIVDDLDVAPPSRAPTSPWVFALGGLAAILLVVLVVLVVLLMGRQGDEGPAGVGTPPRVAASTEPAVVVGKDVQATAESLLPTVTLVSAPKPPAPKPKANPKPGGQPAGDQAPQFPDILPTLGSWATSLAPLFPLGTPGAPPGTGRYAAPTLQSPASGSSFQGQSTLILLTWEPVGDLQADEYYNVSVRYSQGGQVQYAGDWVQTTEWRVPEWLFGRADQGRFEWDVTVHQALTIRQDGSKEGPALSPKSETWFFTWTEGGEKEPPHPQPPVEPTPTYGK